MARLAGTLIYEGEYQQAYDLLPPALAIQQKVWEMCNFVLHTFSISSGAQRNSYRIFRRPKRISAGPSKYIAPRWGEGDDRVAVAVGNLASVYLTEENHARAGNVWRRAATG